MRLILSCKVSSSYFIEVSFIYNAVLISVVQQSDSVEYMYVRGCKSPSPRDLPNPGIKPRSPALQADSLPSEPPGKPRCIFAYICTYVYVCMYMGVPGGAVAKNPPAVQETQETQLSPWVGKIPWRRTWQPTPVFSPGKFHGQRSLAGYTALGVTKSQTQLSMRVCVCNILRFFSIWFITGY